MLSHKLIVGVLIYVVIVGGAFLIDAHPSRKERQSIYIPSLFYCFIVEAVVLLAWK